MKNRFYPLAALLIFASTAFMSSNSSVEWKIGNDHSIRFVSKDPSGSFSKFSGTIMFDESDLANSKFDLTIPVSSISTGNGMMNKKAQIEEWFNAGEYPEIKFVSTKIEKSEKGFYVIGNLKMKGVSKMKKIQVHHSGSESEAKFHGTFAVKRSDYQIGHKSEAVPDVMKIIFNVPVSKK
jgi:polyisoprenoid-binding protein YceI